MLGLQVTNCLLFLQTKDGLCHVDVGFANKGKTLLLILEKTDCMVLDVANKGRTVQHWFCKGQADVGVKKDRLMLMLQQRTDHMMLMLQMEDICMTLVWGKRADCMMLILQRTD